jgi:hypothetical protein
MLWKDTLLMVSEDLKLGLSEELDLLVRYLGPESRRYATSIRSTNIRNPAKLRDRIGDGESCTPLRDVLAYFNSSTGIMPIVRKLPSNLQERWVIDAT